MDTETIESIGEKYQVLQPVLTERGRRLWAATEANSLGRGGKVAVSKATGISRVTINKGLAEIENGTAEFSPAAIRRKGGGKKRLVDQSPELLEALKDLVEDSTRGDPEVPLLWTCKSTRRLVAELSRLGYRIGRQKVSELLTDLGYSLQGNRKTQEGSSHPDRNHQFRYLNARVRLFQRHGQPVISVDTKKKELVGNYSNKGREWSPKGKPTETNSHDFGKERVNPYGVYDQTANEGWVSVGTDHDTAEFAVESIRRWWKKMGSRLYPDAESLLITADCGGSNGYRVRLWKFALQTLSTETGLRISVSHFPPGTSKWNKIEHRMFCHISTNWRGQPLTSHEVIVNLIGNTTTTQGLSVTAELDTNDYPKSKKIPNKDFQAINIRRANFHGDWNYKISPKCTS
jgi:transposase